MHSTDDSTPILWIILLPSLCTAGTCGSILLMILLPIYVSFYFHSTDHSTQNLLTIYLHATDDSTSILLIILNACWREKKSAGPGIN